MIISNKVYFSDNPCLLVSFTILCPLNLSCRHPQSLFPFSFPVCIYSPLFSLARSLPGEDRKSPVQHLSTFQDIIPRFEVYTSSKEISVQPLSLK